MRVTGPFIEIYKEKNFFILIMLIMATITSSLAVIYVKHKNRTLRSLLQRIYIERSDLNTEWSRLLLEKSTLMADLRVEQLAKKNLNMVMPEQTYIIGP